MASRRHHRRTALAVTATLLTLTAAAGCGAVDTALDCVRTADAIATSVDNLQKAISDASDDPTQATEALDRIDKELKDLGDTTDNADLSKAVDDLQAGVTNVRDSIDKGDATPDITPVTDAATEIGKVCTS
jgi:septal ring factor EnvC (AmiA/AmiB activator)